MPPKRIFRLAEGPCITPSLPYREAIIQSTNINCFSEKGEEFQVKKDFRVQPKMPAAPWAFPQKEERLQGPLGGRALEPHPSEPTGPQQVEAGPRGGCPQEAT